MSRPNWVPKAEHTFFCRFNGKKNHTGGKKRQDQPDQDALEPISIAHFVIFHFF